MQRKHFFLYQPQRSDRQGFPRRNGRKIADGFGGMVLVDEAYAPFADYSAATLVKNIPI